MKIPFSTFDEMWEAIGARLQAESDPRRAAEVIWLYGKAAAISDATQMIGEVFTEARERLGTASTR